MSTPYNYVEAGLNKMMIKSLDFISNHTASIEQLAKIVKDEPDNIYSCANANLIVNLSDLGFLTPSSWGIIVTISMLCALVVLLTIWFNKEFRLTHPMQLYFNMAFCLFVMSYCIFVHYIGTIKFMCYWNGPNTLKSSMNLPR